MLRNTFKHHVDLLLIREEGKNYYVLIKCFNTFCMMILYSMEKNIFVAIVCKILADKKYLKIALMTVLKLTVNKGLRSLKKVNILD